MKQHITEVNLNLALGGVATRFPSALPCRSMDTALALIVDRVRAASMQQTPLAIRGGDTKHFHRCAPSAGEVLDMRPLSGILCYDPSELVITVRAGTPLAHVEEALAERGQYLAFEPPHFGAGGTIGGMVASGLSGPARAHSGAVRDFVLGVEIINGRGELLRFGGQVMKNVAGYDVSRFMAGAWGQLGILTEVSLKTLPVPPAEATLQFHCSQEDALARLHAWGAKPLPLNASSWHDGRLWLRLRGAEAAVQWAIPELLRSMPGEVLENSKSCWNDCRNQRLPWFANARPVGWGLWRLSLPPTAPPLVLPEEAMGPLVEWHGALRWVWAPLSCAALLTALAQQAGGSVAWFKMAPPQDSAIPPNAHPLPWPADSALMQLHQRLKQAFDPMSIFNRGAALP